MWVESWAWRLFEFFVLVAQWIERSPPKRQVEGSIPAENDFSLA